MGIIARDIARPGAVFVAGQGYYPRAYDRTTYLMAGCRRSNANGLSAWS